MNYRLLTLRTEAWQAADTLPSRVRVLKWGDNTGAKGKVLVNGTTLSTLLGYQVSQNWDEVALDFEHSSVPGSAAYKGEPVAVAGYGRVALVAPESGSQDAPGVYLDMTRWTGEGENFGLGGHYRDLSAAVILNDKEEVIGIHSVALCRMGATPGITFLSAPWPPVRDNPKPKTAEEALDVLRSAFDLPPETPPAEVLRHLSEAMNPLPTPPTGSPTATPPATPPAAVPPAAPKAEDASPDMKVLSATVASLAESVKTLSTSLSDMQKANEERERATVAAECKAQGKVLPEMAKDLTLVQLKALAASLPVTVPVQPMTPSVEMMLLSSTTTGAPATEDAVSKLTGVTAEMREKYKA